MGSFDECRRALADVAKELDLFTVDGYELVPQMEEMYADTVHPNALGFSVMAHRLAEILKKQFFFLN
jgi:lysophospholipase L1-like esterase